VSNRKTLAFIVILCFVSAAILAILATTLRGPQERARDLDRAKQILAAAEIYPNTADKVYAAAETRLKPMLTNQAGDLYTFEEAGINFDEYIAEYSETGYAQLPNKLLYLLLSPEEERAGYIIPVTGYGLWGPIYGYIALALNADTVIGISWYAPAETPGLGAIIQDPSWQKQFVDKDVFLPGADLATAPLGIVVVKGKVQDLFGDTSRAETAVDGITGATLTGDGVTAAYQASLGPYRNFLIKRRESDRSS